MAFMWRKIDHIRHYNQTVKSVAVVSYADNSERNDFKPTSDSEYRKYAPVETIFGYEYSTTSSETLIIISVLIVLAIVHLSWIINRCRKTSLRIGSNLSVGVVSFCLIGITLQTSVLKLAIRETILYCWVSNYLKYLSIRILTLSTFAGIHEILQALDGWKKYRLFYVKSKVMLLIVWTLGSLPIIPYAFASIPYSHISNEHTFSAPDSVCTRTRISSEGWLELIYESFLFGFLNISFILLIISALVVNRSKFKQAKGMGAAKTRIRMALIQPIVFIGIFNISGVFNFIHTYQTWYDSEGLASMKTTHKVVRQATQIYFMVQSLALLFCMNNSGVSNSSKENNKQESLELQSCSDFEAIQKQVSLSDCYVVEELGSSDDERNDRAKHPRVLMEVHHVCSDIP